MLIANLKKSKFVEEEQKDINTNAGQAVTKVVKVRPDIDEKDWQLKRDNIIKFLTGGYSVKVDMHMRGREQAHQEHCAKVLIRLVQTLNDYCKFELPPIPGDRLVYLTLMPTEVKG